MFDDDHAVDRHGGRFRWLVSTCIAGAIGTLAIFVIIAGSTENQGTGDGFMPALQRLRDGATTPELIPRMRRSAGLKWAVPKTDKLEATAGMTSTRYVIHETVRQRRDGRSYIHAQPYLRVVARLAPVPTNSQDVIPPFNPFQLYADKNPVGSRKGGKGKKREDIRIDVVELIGGVLPLEDGQSLDDRDAIELIAQFRLEEALAAAESIDQANTPGSDLFSQSNDETAFTSKLAKNEFEPELETVDLPGAERVTAKVKPGDTLTSLLIQHGAQTWQSDQMIGSMRRVFPASSLLAGDEVQLTLVPSVADAGKMEPAAFSIYSESGVHRVTVSRNDSGDYKASRIPAKSQLALRGRVTKKTNAQISSSLYAAVYHSALLQNVPQETILKILRTNAYQMDFGRRIRPGDTVELFFNFQDENFSEGPPRELLYTKITSGGETARFYRFRTADGEVDFYDEQGNNSKRFLTRKPVRGSSVRLSSGYGMRYHPLLNRRRMHAGVDWAGPTGTPILAAGRGVIELAGRKGQYGNYVRIRHANGYQTSYAHMLRFARGVKAGVKVRQGQVIGYIGSTGLSSGPHLHYEVLVNKQHVNPMTIKVPRERQLKARELIEYQRERARLDELMRRAPVMTISK